MKRIIIILTCLTSFSCSEQTKKENIYKANDTDYKNISTVKPMKGPFTLEVEYGFGDSVVTISQNANTEIIQNTMTNLNWEKFHIVWLTGSDKISVDVGGSLSADGFASGYHSEGNMDELLLSPAPKTVQELTDILIYFSTGSNMEFSKYEYK